MKILFLPRYDQMGASSRMRLLQYLPSFAAAGIEPSVSPLLGDEMVLWKYCHGSYRLPNLLSSYVRRIRALLGAHRFDLVWIEKEALPWFPAWLEKALLHRVPYMLDFDDAIFHNYDLHRSAWVRRIYGRRIDQLMRGARLVVAGNRYLAQRALDAGAQQVAVVPTVVDLLRYTPKPTCAHIAKPRIVWIGSPSTVKYLQDLTEALTILSGPQPFTLRIIGGGALSMPGVDIESLPWSEETEATLVAECDIGIMPLRDTPWEQGKCAYKLIQYMACGLPTVASPIGANREVVRENATGYFADTPAAWVDKLEWLLKDAALRERLGRAGRARVESTYCLQHTAPELVRFIGEVALMKT